MIKLAQYSFEESFVSGLTSGIISSVSDHHDRPTTEVVTQFVFEQKLKPIGGLQPHSVDGMYGIEKVYALYDTNDCLYILRQDVLSNKWRLYSYTYYNEPMSLSDAVLLIEYHQKMYTLNFNSLCN